MQLVLATSVCRCTDRLFLGVCPTYGKGKQRPKAQHLLESISYRTKLVWQGQLDDMQGLLHWGMSPSDIKHGWDVAVTTSYVAVSLPLPLNVMALYGFQVRTLPKAVCIMTSCCSMSWLCMLSKGEQGCFGVNTCHSSCSTTCCLPVCLHGHVCRHVLHAYCHNCISAVLDA